MLHDVAMWNLTGFAKIQDTCERRFPPASTGKTSTISTFKLLHALICYNRPKHAIEIGCGDGWSTAWMLDALDSIGGGHIDAFEPDTALAVHAGTLLSSMTVNRSATWKIHAIEVEKHVGRMLADFVFLDLDPKENYSTAMLNIEIERDGLLVAHDWKIASPVRDFADELDQMCWDVVRLAGERGMVIARRR